MSDQKKLMQVWNSRSKKWVLYEKGKKSGIIEMSENKYPGIPVKGEGTGNKKSDNQDRDNSFLFF